MCGALDRDERCCHHRVEGTATSDELVVVRAVQVNGQVLGC